MAVGNMTDRAVGGTVNILFFPIIRGVIIVVIMQLNK